MDDVQATPLSPLAAARDNPSGRPDMTRRIMPDHGTYRWTAPLCALVVLMMTVLAPANADAQRRPRLLGRPVAQTAADTVPMADGTDAPAAVDSGLVAVGGAADSREAFPVQRRLEMRSTAYCLRGTMRTGVRVRDGMAAGDPSVLPLGSVVRVSHPDGRLIGIFVIMDTGGAIRG